MSYEKPEMEIIELRITNIVCTSGLGEQDEVDFGGGGNTNLGGNPWD